LATAAAPSPDYEHIEARYLAPLRRAEIPSLLDLGRELTRILFPEAILSAIRREGRTATVRLRLRAAAELAELPWEYAYLEGTEGAGFLAHQSWLWLVREVEGPTSLAATSVGAASSVLVVWADPSTAAYPRLDSLPREVQGVQQALDAPECGRIQVETLGYATPSAFLRHLGARAFDVVHFVGHGDRLPSGSALIFEGGRPGEESAVYGDELAEALAKNQVRIAVLSACHSAVGIEGLAAQLVASGVSAVVAMQFPWADTTAHLFSRAFYASLADGAGIEEAVFHGRMAIRGCGADWGVPVLTVSSAASADWLPLVAPEAPRPLPRLHNLPHEDWPFVGRSRELRNLHTAVVERRRRLVTITGMGGMGKTRLAKEFAAQNVNAFADGVWLLECDSVGKEEELRAALTATVPALEAAGQTWEAIGEALADKQILLVLDCFERLAPHARFLQRLLRAAENLQILVTSRSLLGLEREHEIALGPMSLDHGRKRHAEGIELFRNAASYADPDFEVSEDKQELLESLIQDLEAVPLAIVLAAGRLRHLSLEDLRTRIQTRRLDTLKAGSNADDRHADLLRVVADSFALLTPELRELAVRLCAFHGGFFQEDAAAVLDSEADLLEGISALRDHSLLISQTVGGSKRFRVLDTIREYVERVTLPEQVADVRLRHAEHFAIRAAEIRAMSERGDWHQANAKVWNDAANFRAAFQYAIATQNKPLVKAFASSLARVYLESGARSDFDHLTVAADRYAQADGDLRLRMELAGLEGTLHRREGDFARARDVWLLRARMAEEEADYDILVDSLLDVADLALQQEDLSTVEAMLARVATLDERVRSAPLRASALLLGSKLALRRADPEAAGSLARRAQEMVEGVEGDRLAMYVWISLAQIYRAVGSLEESDRMCRHMIAESLRSGYVHYVGRALLALSATHEEAGKPEEAVFAAVVAATIPRSASPSLRNEAVQRIRSLAERHGHQLTRTAAERASVATWSDLAAAMASA
jgi:predicted ATPase